MRFKPAAMVKNFEPRTRKLLKGITKVIFRYAVKQLAKAEQERNAVKGKMIDAVVVHLSMNVQNTMGTRRTFLRFL